MSMAEPFTPSTPTPRDLPHGAEEPSVERASERVLRDAVPGRMLSDDELDDDLAGSEPTG